MKPKLVCYNDVMFNCKRCNKQFTRNPGDINRGRIHYCSFECATLAKKEQALVTADKVLRLGRKQCKLCNKTRVLNKFPKSKDTKTGYFSYCYDCKRAINREQDKRRKFSDERKVWSRRAYLKRTYNLTQEDYDKLEKSQNGGCAICGELTRMAIDHCHKSGRIRGLLCHNCNRGLGMFADDSKRLTKAIEYLG